MANRQPPTAAQPAAGTLPAAVAGSWSVERPSLEYQYAFDLCATNVHRIGGPVAVFASSPFCARELLKRMAGCEACLVPTGRWYSPAANPGVVLGPEVTQPDVQDLACAGIQTRAAVWAGPERESGEHTLKNIRRVLLPGGYLYIIVSGWLARFLPEWRRDGDRAGECAVGLWRAIRWLRQAGFTVGALYGFHGVRSVLWGYASRTMERLGRSDLADRCLFKMRAGYVTGGWRALLAPLGLIVSRREVGVEYA